MAPDLNTVPPSPYSSRRAARAGEPMASPPAPFISPASVFPGPLARDLSIPAATGANVSSGDNTGVGIGPGSYTIDFRSYNMLTKIRPAASSTTPYCGGFAHAIRERAGSCGK